MGRWKMRLIIWVIVLWTIFLYFPHTLGGIMNKTVEFGKHLRLGRVVSTRLKTWGKAWNPLESWISNFMGNLLINKAMYNSNYTYANFL